MQKSPEAFRTISEVAADLNVPKHVLRFWEGKFSQLRPMKRGGGRRYYRPEDVDLLRGIRQLLYSDGYTIKGVQKILREHGVRFVMDCSAQPGQAEIGTAREIPDVASEAAQRAADGYALQAVPDEQAALGSAAVGELTGVLQELEVCRKLLTKAAD